LNETWDSSDTSDSNEKSFENMRKRHYQIGEGMTHGEMADTEFEDTDAIM
jgi:hypothetical protein